jgi:hypothetical protein
MKIQKIYLITFFLAFFIRSFLIYFTPEKNNMIDLCIYRDTGQLVVNGINPYNYLDQKELRSKLRKDSESYHEHTCQNQDRWNSYAGANLPMASLLFGGIEYIFES